jgi:peptide/nickel transport system substrate-binding protein
MKQTAYAASQREEDMTRLRTSAMIAALAAGAWSSAPGLAQEDKCLRVVGTDWASEQQSVDPLINNNVADLMRLTTIYEKLVELDNGYQPVPVLAESWESDAAGSVWTFHLRKGVKWHDGRDFTAKDVVWTFKRVLDPKLESGAAATLSMLEPGKIEAVDDHTVRFTAKTPTVELPILLSSKYTALVPDGMDRETMQKKPVGTGPYMMNQFAPGPKFVAKRNPNYWKPGLPKAPCIELSGITESVARIAALQSGQADLLIFLEPSATATLAGDPNVKVMKSPGGSVMTLSMWVDTPPFDKLEVRQAMKLVVDREKMVEAALLGNGAPGNDNPVPPSSPDAYRTDIIPRDIEKAKQLLAQAGHADGLSVDLYTSDSIATMVPIAQLYQQMAADAGIKVNIIMSPADSYWNEIWLKRPFITSTWGGRPSAEALSIAYLSKAQFPETHWYRSDYDELIAKANGTVDAGERRKIFQKAQKLLAEEGGVIVPAFASVSAAMRKECSGYEPNNNVNNNDFSAFHCE